MKCAIKINLTLTFDFDFMTESKNKYRKKIEGKLQHNNMRDVWSGIVKIVAEANAKESEHSLTLDGVILDRDLYFTLHCC